VSKELTDRGDELKQLGWSDQDVLRYVELWDYRQRWGAINLERDDRQFLRKAELALPNIKSTKTSIKKPIQEKSYYLRIRFFVDKMIAAELGFDSPEGSLGIWPLVLQEELVILEYFQPVLGLPDTLKAKALTPFREELISSAISEYKENSLTYQFNFVDLTTSLEELGNKSWQPLRSEDNKDDQFYPILKSEQLKPFRNKVRTYLVQRIRETFPSLAESDKPNPPDDWSPESTSLS